MLGLSQLEFSKLKYSSNYIDSNGRLATRPQKLSLTLKQKKIKDVFNKFFEGELN